MAALPDGGVLVLERLFSPPMTLRARVVHIPAEAIIPGAVLTGRELFRIPQTLPQDNYEGLAVRRRDDGRMELLLLSDDNFLPVQRTVLLRFLWTR